MGPGLSGSLLSAEVLLRDFGAAPSSAGQIEMFRRRLHARQSRALVELGPASGARLVFDRISAPLASDLGFTVLSSSADSSLCRTILGAGTTRAAGLLTTPWGIDTTACWRDAVRHAIAAGVRWCLCANGPHVRVFDAHRTYSRRHVEFDLLAASADARLFHVMFNLLSAAAFVRGGVPAIERALAMSEQHRALVRTALQGGVEQALAGLVRAFGAASRRRGGARRPGADFAAATFDESLIVIYRILFLLFAEARGLVPKWHPTYRESYTIEALQPAVDGLTRPAGLWESLQAIARLAHRGCRAGSLSVPPFNGRLFSPSYAPLADSVRLDDETVRSALAALTTRRGAAGPERIAYAELGVEQLGGVYERVLDYEPSAPPRGPVVLVPSLRRKATGTFYTPRSLTEYVVRRTLAPLVREASPEAILALRVLDPAMGSGAFLVAACRYLAAAYEAALVREGSLTPADATMAERAGFRRAIAQRCLYGVDVNPMAVQLARLSLWLATLSGDRPLTFLDHHLRTGNSLAGASLRDIARSPAPRRPSGSERASLPLFEWDDVESAVRSTIGTRVSLATDPGDTLEQVRAKERLLASLAGNRSPLAGWRTVADLWCSHWFAGAAHAAALRKAFPSLTDGALGRDGGLPSHLAQPLLDVGADVARREHFFHWELEFPEVFVAADDAPPPPGFDAVLCNPPWETLRGDAGDEGNRREASERSSRLTAFARTSGVYRLQGDGHANLYQLFVERVTWVARAGGRVGMVLPSAVATDHGCTRLRRHLLDRATIDTFVVVENKDGLFPIHRSLKFLLVTAAMEGSTGVIPQRCGVRSPEALDRLPDVGVDPDAVHVTRPLLVRMSADQLAIPEFRNRRDLDIATKVAYAHPPLGDASGWGVRFGRELNASDDRRHFIDAEAAGRGTMPVVEGKQIRPFGVDLQRVSAAIPVRSARRLLDPARTYHRARLAYRDVSCSTNRLTLIAAIVPRGAVTTHTLFCLKDELSSDEQEFLCGVFNSFVANYLVRLRVGTHVSASIIHQLPVPRPAHGDPALGRVAAIARRLASHPAEERSAAELQAVVAQLYGLTADEFEHVLSTFPLVPSSERQRALQALRAGPRPPRRLLRR
jgi:hypothetical protein